MNCYAYYNEIDPKACAWLRQLIKNGLIMDGEVDERSIIDVEYADLQGFTQHHFFAGIGGWQYALRLAGWQDARPVCTASLPCQPFSVAGSQKGKDDERHLLPHFIELVKQCNFKTIFGEQVPGAIKHGWLDDLCFEMKRENYAVGSIVLTAAGAGAPHIRQRLYWVADSQKQECTIRNTRSGREGMEQKNEWWRRKSEFNSNVPHDGVADRISTQEHQEQQRPTDYERERGANSFSGCGLDSRMGNTKSDRWNEGAENGTRNTERDNTEGASGRVTKHGNSIGLGNTEHQQRERCVSGHREESGENSERAAGESARPMQVTEWTDPEWLYCRDNKYRPVKPGIKPLAHGLPKGMGYSSNSVQPINADDTQEARVMRLKGYGNAIVPQVAAQFISAFMEV